MSRKFFFYSTLIAFPLLVIELLLQGFYLLVNGEFLFLRTVPPIYAEDPVRCYSLRPNLAYEHRTNEFSVTIHTNAQGFRTDARRLPVTEEKREDRFRILFLGPSFAFGWGNEWEDAYTTLIAEGLTVPGKEIEIINLGTPAQPIEQQLCWLRAKGYQYQPDLIVQTVYGDPGRLDTDCPQHLNCPIIEDHYLLMEEPTWLMRFVNVAKNSATIFYGWYSYQYLISGFDREMGLGTELYSHTESDGQDIESATSRYQEYLGFIKGAMGSTIPTAFLYIPYSYVVRPGDMRRWEMVGVENPEHLKKRGQTLQSLLERKGIHFIDPTEPLIQQDSKGRMYYFLDIHLTPEGNRVVAETALRTLQPLVVPQE